MKKQLSTTQNEANIRTALAILAAIPNRLETISGGIPPAQLEQPLGPGERSSLGVLMHLIHCEARSAEGIYLALLLDDPLLLKIHPERQLAPLLRLERLSFAELLTYFHLRRTILQGVLASLTEAQWLRTIQEPDKQRHESVYRQVRGLALHEEEHLSVLEQMLPTLTAAN